MRSPNLPDPAVYRTVVRAQDVLVYTPLNQ